MLVFVSFELTIVVDSVSFSLDIGRCASCVNFDRHLQPFVCKSTIVVAEKDVIKC